MQLQSQSTDPGTPDRRGPGRYLIWLATSQKRRVAAGAVLGSAWMVGLTLMPYLLSRAVDDGLKDGDRSDVVAWAGVLVAVGVANALVGALRHRTMTKVRMDAAFRTVRVVVRHSARLGAALQRRVSAGEVVTIGFADAAAMANALTFTGPGVGAALAFVIVAVLLFAVDPLLAAVVLLGAPLIALLVGPLLGRLQGAETAYRHHQGKLAARFGDIVGGLHVLHGIGGKQTYAERYRRESQALRREGHRVGAVTSWIEALSIGLPALFLAAVTWLAARMAAQGDITVGELIAVYGYAAVLVVPVAFLIEGGDDITRGLVAARRVLRFLELEPDTAQPTGTGVDDGPASPAALHDPTSGVTVHPGRLTALVSERPADGALVVDRLGRFAPSDATWGGVRLDAVDLDRTRMRILVADNEADLFTGPLRTVLTGRHERTAHDVARALHTAVAEDVVRGLPHGLDSLVEPRGRNLSGGQRQRVRLARAVLADPETLLAVDPTSALDAHTEAAVAERLRTARAGRTTLLTTTSPLVLDRADTVHYLVDGQVVATGSHRELLDTQPGYRALVSRGIDDLDPDPASDTDSDSDSDGTQPTEVAR
ncbi:ABC transporter ATP-binding protein [Streptomyces sp. NPDC047315]|uniref:ABC transporter ATP-binding protein n=1 Tax=Streptomyces sp. NPDC047315 TaxID=3155142 RepID=UPI0033CED85C